MIGTKWRGCFTLLILLMISLAMPVNPVQADCSGPPAVQGKAAIIMDAGSGRVLYQKNAHQRMPPASLTKIMTALLVLEDQHLNQGVRISRDAAETGESSIYLKAGEILSRKELLYALMLKSANDAAVALAESISGSEDKFVQRMNMRARQIGLRDTHFHNPHGLEAPGHYTTAYDLALLTRLAMVNPLFQRVVATREAVIPWEGHSSGRLLLNKNRLLYRYPGAIGVKTGYTREAGNCLVGAAQRGSLKLITVVLNSPQVYEDTEKLLDYAFSRYQGIALELNKNLLKVRVQAGLAATVALRPERGVVAAVTPAEREYLSYRITVPASVRAPVQKGETLGRVRLFLKNKEIGGVNLVASQGVPYRPSLWARFLASLRRFFHQIFG